jgi:(p)ppGpp synthase/HD superfamily hydrolase
MAAHAQTIVQLLNRLRRDGWALDDLRLLHRAYERLVALSTCQYRSSGRTLIDHAVGVASILAALGAPVPLVAAGLVHLVYLHGDFGTWRRRVVESKRAQLNTAVGSTVEQSVYGYTQLDWSAPGIAALRDRLPRLDRGERDVVLMRLADQLDIFGTRDALYCDNAGKRRAYARDVGATVVALADGLGQPALAAALSRAFAQTRDAAISPDLRTPSWRDGVIVPPSYRTRRSIALYQGVRSKVYALTGR